MAKKLTRKGIRIKLDKLIKDYIKKRDGYICQKCGKKLAEKNCHGSHVIPVSQGLLWAYDPKNIITLCFHDHINWWHKNPIMAAKWFKKKFPSRYKYIESKLEDYEPRPIKTFELITLWAELKGSYGVRDGF